MDQRTSRAIDQSSPGLHLREALGVNEMMCLVGQRAMETYIIRSRHQCIESNGFHISLLDDLPRHEWVVCEDMHFEPKAQLREDSANGTETDHADAFAGKLYPDEFGRLPLACTHRAIGLRKVSA